MKERVLLLLISLVAFLSWNIQAAPLKKLDADHYYIIVDGKDAVNKTVDVAVLLGPAYSDDSFEKIKIFISIDKKKKATVNFMFSNGDEGFSTNFLSVGRVKYSNNTGFSFTAQLYDLDIQNFVKGGLVINVEGVRSADKMKTTIRAKGSDSPITNAIPFEYIKK